jgi:hypothetical protein
MEPGKDSLSAARLFGVALLREAAFVDIVIIRYTI